MVGYHPEKDVLSTFNYMAAGALSGFVTRGIVQPLDVLKIRFQLQVEPIAHNSRQSKYRGLLQSITTITKEEGLFAFWKGHAVAQGLTAMYMAVEFTTFEACTKLFWNGLSPELAMLHQPVIHFMSGGIAGLVATIVSYPMDILRTRFIAQGTSNQGYKSLYQAVVTMYKGEGPRSFNRGLWAGICHATPQASLHFGCYELYKQFLRPASNKTLTKGHNTDALCGAAAGFTSKLVVYPFDTAKRRLQVIGFEQGRKEFGHTQFYTGITDYMRKCVHQEGFRGLYKGVTWAVLKASVTTSLYFYLYEIFCSVIKANQRQ